jgi:NAD+ synthase (glutamine-hydrolysing)
MKLLRVAAAAVNQTPLDWDRNAANVRSALAEARRQGASLVCLPELCLTGYGCEDAFLSPDTARTASELLLDLLPETRGLVTCFGLPVWLDKAVYNAVCLVADGTIRGFVAKRALAGDGLHYEPRWFKPWPRARHARLRLAGGEFPIGDIHFEISPPEHGGSELAGVDSFKLGFEICEDAWVAERPGLALARDAVDVIFNPSASHFAFGKHDIRRRLVLEGSRAFGVTYVYANLVGNEAGRAIYDGDALIATLGEIVAESPRLVFSDVQVISSVVDLELTRGRHARLASYVPEVEAAPGACVAVPAALAAPGEGQEQPLRGRAAWEAGAHLKEEEFARAIALGLFDYLRKTRSRGFVVSLSGGADSAAVACLVRLMVRFGVAELGLERFVQGLSGDGGRSLWGDALPADEEELVGRLLTTVYQGTQNSSETTQSAARTLAAALGATHCELDVEDLVQGYVARAEAALGRQLNWARDDLALQNIQARSRAPSVWLLANVKGALLLATSNRSEAAVGYATMDGDTAGGLSPLAGIDKAFLRRWLVWLERIGPAELGPLRALAAVNAQQPTAELRPAGAGQTDEADLMPYDVLDVLERATTVDKRGPRDAFRVLQSRFPQHGDDTLLLWTRRFFRLFTQNQWKRERYAPSFHVDDANLDPKTWHRFPILSGGYARELAELERELGAAQ